MGKIIAIANQKGGVGKTTTSINLAAGLAYLGQRVLLIDLDPQGNTTQGVGANRSTIKKSTYDLLLGQDTQVRDVVQTLKTPPLDLIPATIDLAGADLEMVEFKVGRERLLKNKLLEVRDAYDFIIIDCPPSLGLLNTNALTAADSVIIPVQCEYYALEGLTQLLSTIRLVQKLFNPELRIEGVLLTMFDVRTRLSVEVQQEVRKYFKERVYKSNIPRNIKLSEAPSRGSSIFEYDVRSEGAKAYAALAKEVLNYNKEEVK
ncbi:sporulation initiation inhibitor Soj [Erysipelothrix larvae]|uniref:Sporulation initiation inhibitor protein Soj n=1 Tax=Erysipelothrix larvae TaxID=1514105 RepID=A0A109UHP5_9FIRM|nr:AAA family ATPase [Erysipelothrix larvae]AMC94543.1 sporulation initiation inhibitor Soj [Erysipelothrix larvae]